MNTSKVVVVAVAAAILASGGGLAGSVATATPAQAAGMESTTTSPTVNVFAWSFSDTSGNVQWFTPATAAGKVASYTVILKQTGKADRVFTNKSTASSITMPLTGLTPFTVYTVQVKANIVSPTGVKSTVTGESLMHTLHARNVVKAVAPKVAVSSVTNNGMTATWDQPFDVVGWVNNYTVVVKQGTKVIQSITVPDWSRDTGYLNTLNIAGLAANTTYTLEVSTNALSADSTKSATSSKTTVKFVTAAKATSVVVAKPVVTVSTVTATSTVINWKKPVVTKGSISSYGITLTDRSTGKKYFFSRPSTDLSFKMSPLDANKAYTVDVIAKGVSADGKSSSYSVTQTSFTTKAK